jgi:phosphoglycerol transferase MdoB-like AlkP superfamily enzyme
VRIGLLFRFVVYHLVIFTLLRLAFFATFHGDEVISPDILWKSLLLGLRFDVRLAMILATPLLFFAWGRLSPFASKAVSRFWRVFYFFVAVGWALFYVFDFGHYGYLRSRINSSVLSTLGNPDIAMGMLWQSYPVVWITLGFLISLFVYSYFLRRFVFVHHRSAYFMFPPRTCWVVFIAAYIVGLYGNVSQYPLRWSEAFFSPRNFVSQLALNPVLYYIETYSFAKADSFDLKRTTALYPVMAEYFGVEAPSINPLNFSRQVTPQPPAHPFNVVVIVMESMALSKTSLMDNPLDPTPALADLAADSYWFSNYYSPHEATARNLFAIMTAVTDVTKGKSSSRNPQVVDQRLIINSFKEHQKMYFVGGSASWANIRAIFSNNIPDIQIFEEGYFPESRTDVWGVSDLDLLIEANKVFEKQPADKPFFAVVQTASFHRPYTIPTDAKQFQVKQASPGELHRAGFSQLEQYNSIRFSDYSLGYFMELAKKSPYYKNTIFIVTGDHGLPDEEGENVPPGPHIWNLEKYHVPLVIHNKELFPEPTEDQKSGSHLDLMTTAAFLAGVPHVNTTQGRNLFELEFDKERYSFIFNFQSQIGEYYLLNNDFFYRYDNVTKGQLFRYRSEDPDKDIKDEFPEVYQRMAVIAEGYLQTSRYLLFNNKKPATP